MAAPTVAEMLKYANLQRIIGDRPQFSTNHT